MEAVGRIDELVKDYLLFRGLNSTLKSIEIETKNEKDKGFRVDRMIDQLTSHIYSYDLSGLRDYWTFLDQRLFCRLEYAYSSSVRKLEVSLFRLYLINASQNGRQDKVADFFEKMGPELQNQQEWKDWFVLPFIRSPEENTTFAMYFSKQWQDTFMLSLHNFLSSILSYMSVPSLMSFDEDTKKIKKLEDDVNMYKKQVEALLEKRQIEQKITEEITDTTTQRMVPASSMDLMDDFYSISQDTTINEKEENSKSNQIKSFIKNISLPSSPIVSKRPTGTIQKKPQQVAPVVAREEISRSTKVQQLTQQSKTRPKSTGAEASSASTSNTTLAPPTVREQQLKNRQQEEHDRERRELLGVADGGRASREDAAPRRQPTTVTDTVKSSKEKSDSEAVLVSQTRGERSPARLPPEGASRATETRPLPTKPLPPDSVTVADGQSPFLLLSQEEYSEHHSAVTHCRFSYTGHTVASADVDGVVKVWSLDPSPVTLATIMSKSALLSLEWVSKTDRLLLLGTKAGSVKLFDVQEKKTIKESPTDMSFPRVVSLSCSPSGASFVSSSQGKNKMGTTGPESTLRTGKLSVWDTKTMKLQFNLSMPSHPVCVTCTAYNHNGQLLITGAVDGMIRIFDFQRKECIASWTAHQGEVYAVQFSMDETTCYSMGSDGKFLQWSLHHTGRQLKDLPIHSGACGPFILTGHGGYRQVLNPKGKIFAFDAEGQFVLTCAQNGGIMYKLDSDNGLTTTMVLGGHRAPVVSVDWSTALDCRTCLTAAMDGKVHVATLLTH